MFENEQEIRKIVDNFCKERNINKNLFEVSRISMAKGGEKQRIYNNSPIKNNECNYVIKYYKQLKLFVIWNYSISKKMSYSVKTIHEKLSKGYNHADKGNGFHPLNQSYVWFEKEEKLKELLYAICNQI